MSILNKLMCIVGYFFTGYYFGKLLGYIVLKLVGVI